MLSGIGVFGCCWVFDFVRLKCDLSRFFVAWVFVSCLLIWFASESLLLLLYSSFLCSCAHKGF